jgi:uncharacterized protein YdaU (DUF1376 family)
VTQAPAFQFYPADFMTGAPATMEPDQTHVYVWLLCLDWERIGFVYDRKELAKWCRISPARFDKAWRVVERSFVERDGRLFNPRLEKEREKQAAWREKSSKGGHKSAEAKKHHTTNGGARVVEPPNVPKVNTSVFSLQSSSPDTTTTTPASGLAGFLETLDRDRRLAFEARIGMWREGADLPAGVRTPPSDAILDRVATDVMAAIPRGAATLKVFGAFLKREATGDATDVPRRRVSGSFLEVE